MNKGYYILGSVLLGIGAYMLYNKIKNGNSSFNFKSQDTITESEEGTHLNPPNQVPDLATPPLVKIT